MSKLQNLEFAALKVSGENYLKWALDIKIHLKSKELGETIENDNETPVRYKYRAIAIIRHHLEEPLKDQYLTIEDPLDLWFELKNRYDHQRTVLLPKAQYDWKHLRIQDFKSVDEYNSALFKIVSILRLCGEVVTEKDLLEKTLSTFHTSNMVLQQQYRERNFENYSSLISCLLLAEKNNELLMMNNAMRPPGATPLPEAHRVEERKEQREANHVQRGGRGRGRWSGRRNDRGRGRGGYEARGNRPSHDRFGYGRGRGQGRRIQKPTRGVCLRCGMGNHWARTCRTPKHLADLYQKKHGNNPETNAMHHDGEGDFDHENDDLMGYETTDMLQDKEE